MTKDTIEEIKEKIAQFPRKSLIHLPTPLRKLERFSAELGGPDIFIKRDDLTGLAFGGNKSRKLEFIMPDVLNKRADVIITWASLQSNWCMQTAAAARMFGIKPVLILFTSYGIPEEFDGNLLLDYILGADIRIKEAEKGKVVKQEEALAVVEQAANEAREWGHTPYIVSVGGSMPGGSMDKPLGAIGYANAFVEMREQAEVMDIQPTHIMLATGSGATQAGLAVGAKFVDKNVRIIGISVSDEKEAFTEVVLTIAQETGRALGLEPRISREDIVVFDDYIKEGYGVVNKEVAEIIRLAFAHEGIVLDPVYTGKAMAALVDLVKKGYFHKNDKVVFLHTGGTPALFPNRNKLMDLLKQG